MNTDSNSYFSVKHSFSAYLTAWPTNTPLPTETELKAMFPVGMQLVNEVRAMEASCLLQLRNLDDDARTVVDYLKLQSKKIDLVLIHVMEQQAHEGDKCQGVTFGGSGISLESPTPLMVNQHYKMSLHIKDALLSVLCIARCIQCQPLSGETEQPRHLCELEFTQILDEDVEQLVKASLNVQQKQLQLRKKQKQQQP
ncbi:hypothetical protein [Shewanella colwelliana]|uniref:hypothetical protein n=1 Tax=Shewanella colwelliana TaxID=23 RepID=UPI0022AF947D|nr:hypothetical protein [Shewanella colwelliana]MCZ4336485.1 hypothetical protein [Shewanella colwelliana]